MGNSILIVLHNPNDKKNAKIYENIDKSFLIIYTIEAGLKMIGLGLGITKKSGYFRDRWN
jgi:hypothetical protein